MHYFFWCFFQSSIFDFSKIKNGTSLYSLALTPLGVFTPQNLTPFCSIRSKMESIFKKNDHNGAIYVGLHGRF